MSKKLVSLVLVLAIASISSAATIYWAGPVQPAAAGEWNAANWGGTLPVLGADIHRMWGSAGGDASAIVTTTGVAKAGKLQLHGPGGTTKLTIAEGANLQNSGSVEAYNYASSVDVYGAWYAANKTTGTVGSVKLGGKGISSVINVWGLLTAQSWVPANGDSSIQMGNTYTAGGGVLNVYDGGRVVADAITFSGTTNDIKLYGDGSVRVKGDQTATLPLSTRFFGEGVAGNVVATYNAGGDYTLITVPEPTTVALLGLGSLMLLRKKR